MVRTGPRRLPGTGFQPGRVVDNLLSLALLLLVSNCTHLPACIRLHPPDLPISRPACLRSLVNTPRLEAWYNLLGNFRTPWFSNLSYPQYDYAWRFLPEHRHCQHQPLLPRAYLEYGDSSHYYRPGAIYSWQVLPFEKQPRGRLTPVLFWALLPYTAGAFLTALTVGKVGSDINYFLELIGASAIWAAGMWASKTWQAGCLIY